MLKYLLNSIFALLLFSPSLSAQIPLPATFEVVGISKDDALNVRTGPGRAYDDIGSVFPGTMVTAFEFNETGTWAHVNWDGGLGWVWTERLEEAEPLPAAVMTNETEIICSGTEPFWTAQTMDANNFLFSTPDTESQHRIVDHTAASVNSTDVYMFSALEYTGVIRRQQCSDGMSDVRFDWAIDIVVNDGITAELYSGCCTIQNN